MQEHLQKFRDEVKEMMSELEHSLLTLEKKPEDKTLVDAVFRHMHTLKGSAGMFGFDRVTELTHKVESVYTKVKNGEIQIDEQIINLTFNATDLILKLLDDRSLKNKKNKKQFQGIIEELNEYFTSEELEQNVKEKNYDLKTFAILFEPDADVEERGINLKKLFKQLENAGDLKVVAKSVDDEEKYPVNWELYLATNKDEDDIEEIMTFVDLESEILQLSDQNLLLNQVFLDKVNEKAESDTLLTAQELEKIAEEIAKEQEENEQTESQVQKKSTLRVDADKLDDLMGRLSELISIKSEIKLISSVKGYNEISELAVKLEQLSTDIRNDIFSIRLVALDSIRVNVERLIRDTAVSLKKEVQFQAEGMDTELDKTIVEKLQGPLMHIIRNSVDHGIEPAHIRAEKGKPAHGNIKLKAYQSGSYIHIEIADDGKGIDKRKLYEKAMAKNLIESGAKMSESEIANLVFIPGLSTASELSEISGRGVGLDAVKSEIRKLRGQIDISTKKDIGTTIKLKLPLSLSIIDTLLLQTGDMYFAVPMDEVNSCMIVSQKEQNELESKYLKIDSEPIPYLSLREIFATDIERPASEIAVLIKKENESKAIIADKVLGEYQAVVKPMGEAFRDRPFLSGGSLMADGNITYILDADKLVKHYEKKQK
jgi:two-component system chemotaxis sensor kinase CheA